MRKSQNKERCVKILKGMKNAMFWYVNIGKITLNLKSKGDVNKSSKVMKNAKFAYRKVAKWMSNEGKIILLTKLACYHRPGTFPVALKGLNLCFNIMNVKLCLLNQEIERSAGRLILMKLHTLISS